MSGNKTSTPPQYKGVMVSSTFTDLELHRGELMKALRKEKLFAIGMEDYVPVPGDDVISSSLGMVREGSAYIGLISHRCGQVPECAERNPKAFSVTRLEFEEAQQLGRPTLIFVMGDDHPVTRHDVETDAEKIKKLEAYRKRAKDGRIYVVFDHLEDFTRKAIHAVASLRRYLEQPIAPPCPPPPAMVPLTSESTRFDPLPQCPAFYAEPAYIGSHEFVGRRAQLDTLNDWASPTDPHTILLFEAIGGAGKSMLTWHWTTKHANTVRSDWAGIIWYSFYEKDAVMADFCRRALAYVTGQPIDDFRRAKTGELGELLLRYLQAKPFLLILDGLERVLVAYHRFDAAQLADEEAGTVDKIAHRDPCAAICPEDDDLLRALAAAAPSKLLLTSRLIPRILLNTASQPIPGVLRERLPGLRPADAEALLRACGVTGTSQGIQDYLKSHCDCHPLVTGVLAGLVHHYFPDRGNFDAWSTDPEHGGGLNLASLNLNQKRNHILNEALAALPEKGRQLLSTLALLSQSVDATTLSALNPHLPPEPEWIDAPADPKGWASWETLEAEDKSLLQSNYQTQLQRRREYEGARILWKRSQAFLAAPEQLKKTVYDLEHRGLLQYDRGAKRYDLHPVVRGIASGSLSLKEKDRCGQRVVDHFSRQTHNPYEEAETLDDIRGGLHVVRTLLQMGRHEQASNAYIGGLAHALKFNLEAYREILSLLRPFFPRGWALLPQGISTRARSYLANDVATVLHRSGEHDEAAAISGANLLADVADGDWMNVCTGLSNIANFLHNQNYLAKAEYILLLSLVLAALTDDNEGLFSARLSRFKQLVTFGRWREAETIWHNLEDMGRNWPMATYRSGMAEYEFAYFRHLQGDIKEEQLAHVEQLAASGKNRGTIRDIHRLRGEWAVNKGEWALAVDSFHEAVRMAREIGKPDGSAEAQLVLAKLHLGRITNTRHEAEKLAQAKHPAHLAIAELWLAIGDRKLAGKHAIMAYRHAWADGEPYVHRSKLKRSCALLKKIGVEIPDLPCYDPAKEEPLPWEDTVVAAIKKLQQVADTKRGSSVTPDAPA